MPNFGHRHYVPILKAKKGEFDALSWVTAQRRPSITPLIEIFTVPWDWSNDEPAKTLGEHLASSSRALARAWDEEAFVDTVWLEPDLETGGVHHLEHLFTLLRADGAAAVPTGAPGRGAAHTAAVAAVAAEDRRGACLRLDPDEVRETATLGQRVDSWLAAVALTPTEVDLVVDFGEVTSNNVGAFSLAARALLPVVPHLDEWRSLTLAAGAFPRDLRDVGPDAEAHLERHDWELWRDVAGALSTREPAFGDYAVAHPELFDPDPRAIRPSASIRYAAPDRWLIVKRRWVRHGFDQYHDASAIVQGEPEWRGAAHCRGDAFIHACAAGGQTGNLTTWRAVATSHHLEVTVESIASLP